jgi:hypothetical protein
MGAAQVLLEFFGQSMCLRCRRSMSKYDRKVDTPSYELRGRCGYCAMPVTDAARDRLEPAHRAGEAGTYPPPT